VWDLESKAVIQSSDGEEFSVDYALSLSTILRMPTSNTLKEGWGIAY